jgi:hypothetical protein
MSSLHSLAEFLASLIAWFDSKEKGTAVVLFLRHSLSSWQLGLLGGIDSLYREFEVARPP